MGISWMPDFDLSHIRSREELYPLYKKAHPDDTSNIVIGQQVGQIARFLLEIQAGDYVITPASDTDRLHYGVVAPDPSYLYAKGDDGCPYRHRRRVNWSAETLKRGALSVPLQNTICSSLTVFAVSQREEFLAVIGRSDLASKAASPYDPYRASGELEREATVAKDATVQREGKREVVREIEYYNLDAIISVGYRVSSTRATRFRQWATRVLREYLTQGYALDRIIVR